MISKNFTKTHLTYDEQILFKDLRNDKIFILIMILNYMFKNMDTGNEFSEKIKSLLKEYPEIPLEALGFTKDWEERLQWA